MAEEIKVGCSRPKEGPVEEEKQLTETQVQKKEEALNMIQVGKKAPDFTASGYHQGKFINFKLSDNFGKWLVLCFYPGDFTFV